MEEVRFLFYIVSSFKTLISTGIFLKLIKEQLILFSFSA